MTDGTPLLTLTTNTARNLWLCDECANGVVNTVFAPEKAAHQEVECLL